MATKKEINAVIKKNAPLEGWVFYVFQSESGLKDIGCRIAASEAALQKVVNDLLKKEVDHKMFHWSVYGPHKRPENNFKTELRKYIS